MKRAFLLLNRQMLQSVFPANPNYQLAEFLAPFQFRKTIFADFLTGRSTCVEV
jgi:hypothetical protein